MTPTSSFINQVIQQHSYALQNFKDLIEEEFKNEHRMHGAVAPTFASLHFHGGNKYETFKTQEFTLNKAGCEYLKQHNFLHRAPIMCCMTIFGLTTEDRQTNDLQKVLVIFVEDPIYSSIMTWRQEPNPDNNRERILVKRPHIIAELRMSPNLTQFRAIIDNGLSLQNTKN